MHLHTVPKTAFTRPAMEFDALPVVMMAHALAAHHGDEARLRLHSFMRDACGENPRCHVFVVEDAQHQIAGFAAGHFTYEFHHGIAGFEIQNFFIRPEFRGTGLGQCLARDVVKFAIMRGCTLVTVSAQLANRQAVDFYLKLGFAKGTTTAHSQRFRLEGEHLNDFMEKN